MQLFRPLPPSLARTRLKYNALAQFLFTLIQHFFTPYGTIRRNLVFLLDEHVQHRVGAQSSWAALVIGGLETLVTCVLVWNIVEAKLALQRPQASELTASSGPSITPSRVSSPLTRPYITPDQASAPIKPTPLPSSSLHRFTTPSAPPATPTRVPNPAHRSSPLSASTAKIFNLAPRTPESTGLFYDPNSKASPSKLAQSQSQSQPSLGGQSQQGSSQPQPQSQLTGTGAGNGGRSVPTGTGDFVLIDREERDFVENVWKGVRGKGGRVGIWQSG